MSSARRWNFSNLFSKTPFQRAGDPQANRSEPCPARKTRYCSLIGVIFSMECKLLLFGFVV
jgi:hypothetical protein